MDTLITNKWLFERIINTATYNKEMSQLLLNTLSYNSDIPDDIKAEAEKLIHAIIDASCSAIDSSEAALTLITENTPEEKKEIARYKQLFGRRPYTKATHEETTETFTEDLL